ncbi:MAG: acetate--CoA ligase family protein [Bacteroidales bacterium]|nr:acetate--CoA ligase family protein [Bacteroidales bacterium]
MEDLRQLRQQNLETIFHPKSVAIVGTNKVKGTVPHDILDNILKADFNGIVYPVSPGEKSIKGIKAYKYVVDIPDDVDLAILVFPSSVCHMALEQCGQKGIKSVIIISAGYKEVGEAGLRREQQLVEIARKYDISFIGPNCLGVINTAPGTMLNASFAREMPEQGNIGFLSQSGALCTAVLDYASAKHIGFSKFISFGNKADISEIDLLYYLMNDEETKVILMYLEEVSDGTALMQAARDVIEKSGKPILVIKSGRTDEGASAAASHTGSMTGKDEVCDAAFEQAGIIRCNNIEEMFNKAIAFAYQAPPASEKVAIITNAGGPGVLTTDAAITTGLKLAKFSEKTTAILKKALPATANIHNPVDVIGDARSDRYLAAIQAAFEDPDVAGVFVILTPQSMTDIDAIAADVARIAHAQTKPIYTSFMGEKDVASGIDLLQRHRIPHYILPESMCTSCQAVYHFHKNIKTQVRRLSALTNIQEDLARKLMDKVHSNGRSYIPEVESIELLKTYGLPVPRGKLATSASEAVKIAEEIGYPVVLKVVSDDIVHKSDVKGVELNLGNAGELTAAWDRIHKQVEKTMPDASISGLYVVRMITGSEEIILGIKRDPSFGPVLMFGLGGIFVEIFRDVSFGIAPLSREEARKMIERTRAFKILRGTRGRNPRDIESIVDALQRLGQLALDFPEIEELDINPLFVMDEGQGSVIGDARMILTKSN